MTPSNRRHPEQTCEGRRWAAVHLSSIINNWCFITPNTTEASRKSLLHYRRLAIGTPWARGKFAEICQKPLTAPWPGDKFLCQVLKSHNSFCCRFYLGANSSLSMTFCCFYTPSKDFLRWTQRERRKWRRDKQRWKAVSSIQCGQEHETHLQLRSG